MSSNVASGKKEQKGQNISSICLLRVDSGGSDESKIGPARVLASEHLRKGQVILREQALAVGHFSASGVPTVFESLCAHVCDLAKSSASRSPLRWLEGYHMKKLRERPSTEETSAVLFLLKSGRAASVEEAVAICSKVLEYCHSMISSVSLRCFGSALFQVGSCINHSCLPNSAHFFLLGDIMEIRAVEEIKEGEEVTISYEMSVG